MAHYYRFMPKTFSMLKDKKIVFFYEDEDILTYVKSIADTPHFLPIRIQVTDLPTYVLSADYLTSCKNQDNAFLRKHNDQKGLIHYRREYMKSGEDSYRKVISIWTSKIFLVDRVIQENPYSTDAFAWVDVSVSRIGIRSFDKMYSINKINTNPGNMLYIGEKICNSAGLMLSNKETWLSFIALYKEKMEAQRHSNYAHDEETIIHLICKDHQELFNIIH